ncbi:MAG: hemolysin family protein, partial [Candidatus Kapabacteria bacterium]|nr:hemolysin family protein [Candidatus Kapabacteria bacterium]
AKVAQNLIHHLDAYLSATQLGITLASLGLGWIGESVVTALILNVMNLFGLDIDPETAHGIALPIAFLTITFLHIIFGELAPKSMAIQRPEQVTMFIAIPLRVFYLIFKPFIWVLNSFANFIIRRLGFEPISEEEERHSSQELRLLIDESEKSGVIDTEEHRLLENVFDFAETPVKQVMIPRGKIFGIEYGKATTEILERFIDEGFSRVPVYRSTIDNIIGIIYAKDLISILRHERLIIMHDIIRKPYFINEGQKINDLLRDMQKNKVHLAVVLDEFGGTAGLVTLEDIIEEIVGEIQDEYDEEQSPVLKINEAEFILYAGLSIDDANDHLPVPLPEDDNYETLAGLIIDEIGRIPEAGEIIDLINYKCEILKRSTRSVEQIKLSLLDIIETTED